MRTRLWLPKLTDTHSPLRETLDVLDARAVGTGEPTEQRRGQRRPALHALGEKCGRAALRQISAR